MSALAPLGAALRLIGAEPGLGGLLVRGGGALIPAIEAAFAAACAPAPVRRLPSQVAPERLTGGLDLAATLAAGRPVTAPGLLAEQGALTLAGADRIEPGVAALLAAALDRGGLRLLAFAEEEVPAPLAERLGLWIDLRAVPLSRADLGWAAGGGLLRAPLALAPGSPVDDARAQEALAAAGAALGVDSTRPLLFAWRLARAEARRGGRHWLDAGDLELAAALVLAPRATRLPPPAEPAPPPPPEAPPPDPATSETRLPEEVLVEAARAALPRDLLARLAAGAGRARAPQRGKGATARAPRHGRPAGARAGMPGSGRRLALIETLRAAAPWQRLRAAPPGRLAFRRDDLRIQRLKSRQQALTIVAVDASGSAALARLAEAKGAVELLLAQAYVKRAQVALIAFRGREAALLLPPTRSLARARRELAELPGGGATPVAAGLEAARLLAEAAARRGRTPYLVVLSDGRANIAADGSNDRARAEADALTAARALAEAGVASAFVDISPRPRPEGARLAQAMHARYLPLPRADAQTVYAALEA